MVQGSLPDELVYPIYIKIIHIHYDSFMFLGFRNCSTFMTLFILCFPYCLGKYLKKSTKIYILFLKIIKMGNFHFSIWISGDDV